MILGADIYEHTTRSICTHTIVVQVEIMHTDFALQNPRFSRSLRLANTRWRNDDDESKGEKGTISGRERPRLILATFLP